MTYYSLAQKRVETAMKLLFRIMTEENSSYLTNHPIESYLNKQTVKLDEANSRITFNVGPYAFVIEPEYILFQGANNAMQIYLHIYEYITGPLRLLVQGLPRIYRLNEITISVESNGYSLPRLQNLNGKHWITAFFDGIVEYLRNQAGEPRYEIFEEENVEILSSTIWDKVQEGWQPVGGVATVFAKLGKDDVPDENGEARLFYLQAMIK